VFDFNDVPLIDTTAAKALEGFVQKLQRANTQVFIAGARTGVRRTLIAAGMRVPKVLYASTVEGVRARPPASAIAIPLSVDPAIGRLNRLLTKVDVVHSGNQTPRMSLAMGRFS
jgi:MFS superfamily sulfate permease-like transporter